MADGDDDGRTIEISVSEDEYERLERVADDGRDAFVREALSNELRVREAIDSLEARQNESGGGVPDDHPPGPLDSPVGALLGFELERAGDGEAVLSMEASRRHANAGGPVQGGILTSLADTATALAFLTTLEPSQSTTNMELKINFLRPVFDARLTARASVVERGRTVGLVECNVRGDEDELVARMSTTYMVLRGDRAEGR